jgi:hypothetical protein
MLKSLSDKYKFYILLAGFGLLLIICYQVAINGTVKIARQYRILKERAAIANDIPKKTAALNRQLNTLNSKYFSESENTQSGHEIILEKISRISSGNSVLVVGYPARHSFQTASVLVETHSALLRGRFTDLLKVIYALEVLEHTGRISSVEFFTETDRKTKSKQLFSRIYIQNYHNLSDYDN